MKTRLRSVLLFGVTVALVSPEASHAQPATDTGRFFANLGTLCGKAFAGKIVANEVWAMEMEPGKRFVYELARPGRLFRVEFDLTREVEPLPSPWGHEGK